MEAKGFINDDSQRRAAAMAPVSMSRLQGDEDETFVKEPAS